LGGGTAVSDEVRDAAGLGRAVRGIALLPEPHEVATITSSESTLVKHEDRIR
jgi:hypothetical protein